jgi:hypothetical protein
MLVARVVSVVLVFAGSAISQTIPVAGGGSALASAVASAPNGAILVVAPGTYSAVSATRNGDLTIVAPQGATVGGIDMTVSSPWQLTLAGLAIAGPPVIGGGLSVLGNLRVESCTGWYLRCAGSPTNARLYVRDCTFGGVDSNYVWNVDAVLLDSTFTGSTNASGQVGSNGFTFAATGSLRAERIHVTGGTASVLPGAGLVVSCDAWLVDSTLNGGIGPIPNSQLAIASSGPPPTLSNCVLAGAVTPTPTLRTVPSASWLSAAWIPGGTSTVRFSENPNEICAVIASLDVTPWSTPLAAERLWVGLTPWFVVALGVTGAGADFVAPFTIPNSPAVQYASLWLTGAFVDPLPLRTTCPLGGLIR